MFCFVSVLHDLLTCCVTPYGGIPEVEQRGRVGLGQGIYGGGSLEAGELHVGDIHGEFIW